MGRAPQTAPIVAPSCLGGPNKAGITPVISILVPNALGNLLGVSAGEIFPRNLFQSMIGGDSLVEEPFPGTEDNLLVPWSPCAFDLDREVPSGSVVEGLSPVSDMPFTELCVTRTEGEGLPFYCSRHLYLGYIWYLMWRKSLFRWIGVGPWWGASLVGLRQQIRKWN